MLVDIHLARADNSHSPTEEVTNANDEISTHALTMCTFSRNMVKLSLYRHFTNTLIFAVIASVIFMLFALRLRRVENCTPVSC